MNDFKTAIPFFFFRAVRGMAAPSQQVRSVRGYLDLVLNAIDHRLPPLKVGPLQAGSKTTGFKTSSQSSMIARGTENRSVSRHGMLAATTIPAKDGRWGEGSVRMAIAAEWKEKYRRGCGDCST